jgi:indolepyruvate ferredoxin oxidoreductase
MLSRPDPRTGMVHKREFGPWVMQLFRVLARLKGLRGTALDPFARLPDRKLERQLIADYEKIIDEILGRLDAGNHAVAVELASLSEMIRGYGHVKTQHLAQVRVRQEKLLGEFRAVPTRVAVAA